jgi:hypothetical protein
VKGEYEREESYGEIHSFGGGGSILRRRIYFRGRFFCGDLWCEEFGFGGFWESKARGIVLLGVLGTGARISLRYPRTGELDRLLIDGKEENSVLGSV